jgi:hypothetical protein
VGRNVPAPSLRAQAAGLQRQAVLLSIGCVSALVLLVVLAKLDRSTTGEWQARVARASSLAADAQAIAGLRDLPQQATEVGLPRADLLERVTHAMQVVQLPAEALVSTLPQPPRQQAGSAHAEMSYRLVFENVALEPLVRFCHTLTAELPALRTAGIQLRAGRDRQTWSADVTVAYWVLTPGQRP